MNDFKDRIEKVFDELKTERDDLRVRLHLVKLESSEEWLKIEHKLVKLESKARELGSATAEASGDMAVAAQLLAEEIRDGKIVEQEFNEAHAKRMSQMAAEGRQMKHVGEMPGFSDIDTNDDGVISEEEFAAHQAEHRAQMQQQKK